MHLPLLDERQRANVRRIDGDHLSQRSVSLYIRHDYVRERTINTVTDTLKLIIPEKMIAERVRKYGVKLR